MMAQTTVMANDQHLLYRPINPLDTATFRFLALVNSSHNLRLSTYHDLYSWSTAYIDKFWSLVWDFTGVVGHKGDHVVDNSAIPSDNPPWFSDAKLNWAENMLQCRLASKVALIQATEPTAEYPEPELRKCTYSELYTLVAHVTSALLLHGLKPGDRVASYSSNCIENVVACLATAAIGGIWVSAAADFGPDGVLERVEQVQPKILFAVDAVIYNSKIHHHIPKVSALLQKLSTKGLQPTKVVIIHAIPQATENTEWNKDWINWEAFVAEGRTADLGRTSSGEIKWCRLSFDAPLWILFSSGTTGRPKPIVHRAGGMLLQSKKEFVICADLQPHDVFFYYTTTGWMMWNFLISGLSVGCTLVLYDGSPLRRPSFLWDLVDRLGITVFGTSAKYIDQLSKGYKPRQHHKLDSLRHIYSTGSPLASNLYDYVYEHIKSDVLLGSITGGTDICSLFAGMCSALPVYRGEIQCRMLGMAMESFTPTGALNPPGEAGELVCTRPFPCTPLGFWPLLGYGNDEDVNSAKSRFFNSYFSEFDGVWYHGDHVVITHSKDGNGGGLIMLGRSDGVLNPGGIRFGSSELYDVIESCFSSPTADYTIVDCLAVGQKTDGGLDERVILFVKLSGRQLLSAEFIRQISNEIRSRRSPRHVPAFIIQAPDIPYTLNGKRVEVLVKKIINGAPLSGVNLATLSNPECLQYYVDIGTELRSEVE